ncbi:MAG TPA: hypothetical protein PKA43_00080 [Candidatus Competibacter phosphatis]|nr:hypothetical protein [Candidatus Competibacter phosphatis]
MNERARADRDGVAVGHDITDSGIVSGNDNQTNRASADVHIALDRMTDMSERELSKIEHLSTLVETLSDEFIALRRALIGDERYRVNGLVQQFSEMIIGNRRRDILIIIVLIADLAQWLVIAWMILTGG